VPECSWRPRTLQVVYPSEGPAMWVQLMLLQLPKLTLWHHHRLFGLLGGISSVRCGFGRHTTH
jgi:hypothetical protein